jgi:hypothetical protein
LTLNLIAIINAIASVIVFFRFTYLFVTHIFIFTHG